jgi:hypothetical protein
VSWLSISRSAPVHLAGPAQTEAMRRLGAALMVLAGLLIAPPVAAATPVAAADPPLLFCWYPVPTGWVIRDGQFDTCADCWERGEAGVSRGDWPDYRCKTFPAGLDVVYYLYIPPPSGD